MRSHSASRWQKPVPPLLFLTKDIQSRLFSLAIRGFNKGGKPAIGQFLRGSLPLLTSDKDTKREKMTSVCFGLLWSEKCKQNHARF